jgi:hypothetical protein
MMKHPPLMLLQLSSFVLEVLPWALSGVIGLRLVWNLVM